MVTSLKFGLKAYSEMTNSVIDNFDTLRQFNLDAEAFIEYASFYYTKIISDIIEAEATGEPYSEIYRDYREPELFTECLLGFIDDIYKNGFGHGPVKTVTDCLTDENTILCATLRHVKLTEDVSGAKLIDAKHRDVFVKGCLAYLDMDDDF